MNNPPSEGTLGRPCPKPIVFAQGSQDGDRSVGTEDI